MTSATTDDAQLINMDWHNQSAEDELTQIGSSADGLSAQEATQRLLVDGSIEINHGKRISPLQIIFGQFESILIWFLIAVGVISGVLGEMVDAIASSPSSFLTPSSASIQEFNAEKSIAALKKMTACTSSTPTSTAQTCRRFVTGSGI